MNHLILIRLASELILFIYLYLFSSLPKKKKIHILTQSHLIFFIFNFLFLKF